MSIDFHSAAIRGTYATRSADARWSEAMKSIINPTGQRIADIGCGGGIYSRAWRSLGAAEVIGVDFSEHMVSDAREASAGIPALSFVRADALDTGLPDGSIDIVFQRALIHHLADVTACFAEVSRILVPGGTLIVQDRVYDDVLHPASPHHLRGYVFDVFPKLLEIERERRPSTDDVSRALEQCRFINVVARPLVETRRTYGALEALRDDLRRRTGRSILHALTDAEIERLIDHVSARVEQCFPLEEHDFWTVWSATKSG